MAGNLVAEADVSAEAESNYHGRRMRISVVIPVRPGDTPDRALKSLAEVEFPQECLEILVVEGSQPSVQRNEAVRTATGDIVYFLDNDSEADIDLFRFVVRSFADPQVAVVGGPSEIPSDDSFIQKCFGYVLGSYFAVANVRCRYKAIGREPQRTAQHKLILCNLGVRRDIYLAEGGLDERLYPNEENEFLARLDSKGHVLLYNPRAVVRRPHRTSLPSFILQMFRYGRGRAQQFLLHPESISPAYLSPLGLLAYLLSLPFVVLLLPVSDEAARWYLAPAGLYAFASALSTGRIVIDEEDLRPALLVPFLFLVVHASYATGMLFGLLCHPWRYTNNERLSKKGAEVTVKVEKPFGVHGTHQ